MSMTIPTAIATSISMIMSTTTAMTMRICMPRAALSAPRPWQCMLDHNIHHAAELNDLAGQLTGEARHQMLHAVEAFDQANGYLSAALELLK